MRAHAHVQDGDVHLVVHEVDDVCHQFAGLPADGFAGFHDDLEVRIARLEIIQQLHQLVPVVVLARDVVAATEVHPLHLRQVLAEMFFESGEHAFQCVGVLFAQRVEVQPVNAV